MGEISVDAVRALINWVHCPPKDFGSPQTASRPYDQQRVTVVNVVTVPVLVHSKTRPIFRPNARPARTLAGDAVGPAGSAEARGPAFSVMTSTVGAVYPFDSSICRCTETSGIKRGVLVRACISTPQLLLNLMRSDRRSLFALPKNI
jgi:hypothetical protein